MRGALVDKTKKVVSVIIAGSDYTPPDGLTFVRSDAAGIGHVYDGTNFTVAELPQKDELTRHAMQRYGDVAYFPVSISVKGVKTVIVVEMADQTLLHRLGQRAVKDATMTFTLAQPRSGTSITLAAAEIIALNEAVSDFHAANHLAYAGVLAGITSGAITIHRQIDWPPAPVPAWPPRYGEALG